MIHLLDVNVLVALAWPHHVHHQRAHQWFTGASRGGWATCPITQAGFIRVSSNRTVNAAAVSVGEAVAMLIRIQAFRGHRFWRDDIPFPAEYAKRGILTGHRQVTDAYLLALARKNQGKLATLDQGLRQLAEGDPGEALEII